VTTVYGDVLIMSKNRFNGVLIIERDCRVLAGRISKILGFAVEIHGNVIVGKKLPNNNVNRYGKIFLLSSGEYIWMISIEDLEEIHTGISIDELCVDELFEGVVLIGEQISPEAIERILTIKVHILENEVLPLNGKRLLFVELGLNHIECGGCLYRISAELLQEWRDRQ